MLRFLVVAVLAVFTVAPAASAQCPITFPGCDATLVAGDGEEGEGGYGDNGPATEARFGFVAGLDLGPDGSLWIADRDDGRIRKISPGGTISTVRDADITGPTGVVGFGEGFAATDPAEDEVSRFNPHTTLGLVESQMIADIDASDIERTSDNTAYFVADPGNDRVLLVRFNDFTLHWDVGTAADGIDDADRHRRLAGRGPADREPGDRRPRRLPHPQGPAGPRDRGARQRFRASAPRSVSFTQPAPGDGGPAIDAWLNGPSDVEVTPDGGYIIAEADRLRRVGPDGIISTIWASSAPVSPTSPAPRCTGSMSRPTAT